MILVLQDAEGNNELVLHDAVIVDTYRNNSLGFWCRYSKPDGAHEGQFFVDEYSTLKIYHD